MPKSLLVSTSTPSCITVNCACQRAIRPAEPLKDEPQNFHHPVSQTGKLLFEHRSDRQLRPDLRGRLGAVVDEYALQAPPELRL